MSSSRRSGLARTAGRFSVVALALGALVAAAPADGAFPGRNGKIASFTYPGDGIGEIHSMNPDGSGRTNLTNHPATDREPAWSPDGTRLAFSSDRDGDYDIYTINGDGSGLAQATNDPARDAEPAWSPDGTKLAFTRDVPGVRNGDIYSMNADGSGQVNLTGEAPGFNRHFDPAWSPNGAKILYSCCSNGFGSPAGQLYVMNADGSGKAQIVHQAYYSETGADWSPDGQKIVYSAGFDRFGEGDQIEYHVHVMSADGSGEVRLTTLADDPVTPAWSPDGKKIVFGYAGGLNVMNADGSGKTQISSFPPLVDWQPSWQPVLYDRPQSATTLRVSLVPALRQTISSTQCQARGGTPSTHGSPLSFTSCNPPGYLPNTAARLGPSASGYAQLTVVPGNLFTALDEADVSVVVNLSDLRNRLSGADYDPVAGGPDITLHPLLRVSDTDNGTPATSPATTSDFGIPVPVPCAPTGDPALGSTCTLGSSLDAVTPGAIKEGRKAAITVWRTWLYDAGSNAVRGDSDDRQFAQQGIYIP